MFSFSNFQHSSKPFRQMKRSNTIFMFKIKKKIFFQFSFSKSKNDSFFLLKSVKKKNANAFLSPIQNLNQTNGFAAKIFSFFFFFFNNFVFFFEGLMWPIWVFLNFFFCLFIIFFFIERLVSIFFFILCKCYKEMNNKKN